MPVFYVTLYRETVDEITIPIEAAQKEDITKRCLRSVIYEGINSITKIRDRRVVKNDIRIEVSDVGETKVPARLVLLTEEDELVIRKPPKKLWTDPRQITMFEKGDN